MYTLGGYTMSKRLTVEQESKIVEMYKADHPVKEIMVAAGCCWLSVYNVLKRRGIEPKGDSRLPYKPKPYVLPAISPLWAAEFRGFFWADGSAGMNRRQYTNKGGVRYPIYYPVLRIELRADNGPLLEHIKSVIGGNYYPKKPSHKGQWPKVSWYIGGYSQCKTVIETILLGGIMPAKKRDDVDILYRAILERYSFQNRLTDVQRAVIHSFYLELKSVKLYSGS